MPWKATSDPYKIWLSEVILQQTRVAQGLPYYLKFVEHYPTVADLAAAPADDVMKLWQGLGYYSRARNMHHAAKTVVDDFAGVFPSKYEDVLSLKGVGKYTAAAIMSFAYGASHPVVDGNVLRVIARLHGILEAVDDRKTVEQIYKISQSYIDGVDPAKFNQAIMDLGALVCKPRNPLCDSCPFTNACVAKEQDLISRIPYKAKRLKKRTRYFHYLHFLSSDGLTVLHLREDKDIWQGLYSLPVLEKSSAAEPTKAELVEHAQQVFKMEAVDLKFSSIAYKHVLTHQTLIAKFHLLVVEQMVPVQPPFISIAASSIDDYAVPVLISNYLHDRTLWKQY